MAYESVRERPHAPFVEMGRREAAEHARWFASTVGERVESLRSYALAHGCRGPLDLSRESLLPLWSWFLGRSEVARPPGGGLGQTLLGLRARPQEPRGRQQARAARVRLGPLHGRGRGGGPPRRGP